MKWLFALAALLLASTAAAAARAAPPEVRRFALVIGNNRPETASGESLRYADDDAVATHLLLAEAGVQSLLFATFDAETRALHPSVAVAGAASWPEIQRGFATLRQRMNEARAKGARTELLFFYSGHGDVDGGEGYVVLAGQRLTRTRLFALLSQSPATYNHVFVDACKSYFLVFDRGPGGRRAPYAGNWVEGAPASVGNTGFVLSTSSDRESHEWERYQGGILSHELRSGLRGAADADGDGSISYAELGAFLATANRAIPNPRFKPDFLVRAPGQDLDRRILSYPASRAALHFAPQSWGHVYIENARGVRILDAHPSADRALRLFVPDERPLFVRQDDEHAEYVVEQSGSVAIAALSPTAPQFASRGALSLAFRWMFSVPFDPSAVQQFRAETAAERSASRADDSEPIRSSTRRTVARVTGVAALGAGAAGMTLSAISLGTSLSNPDESQRARAARNQRIQRLNVASVACYGTALAAGLVWAWAKWWPESNITITGQSAESLSTGTGTFGLGVAGHF